MAVHSAGTPASAGWRMLPIQNFSALRVLSMPLLVQGLNSCRVNTEEETYMLKEEIYVHLSRHILNIITSNDISFSTGWKTGAFHGTL